MLWSTVQRSWGFCFSVQCGTCSPAICVVAEGDEVGSEEERSETERQQDWGYPRKALRLTCPRRFFFFRFFFFISYHFIWIPNMAIVYGDGKVRQKPSDPPEGPQMSHLVMMNPLLPTVLADWSQVMSACNRNMWCQCDVSVMIVLDDRYMWCQPATGTCGSSQTHSCLFVRLFVY